ncbi:serine/threonine protein kinase [Fusibacter sp. JL216-2]|uniref:serine/threonine protein kinase n=1 Tax=Fusibacter sp. JL216-2 TaxID=3071453 RepID=UPI003D357E5B
MDKTSVLKNAEPNLLTPAVDPSEKIGGKYKIIHHLGVPSGQADLYLCEYRGKKRIVKLYKNGVQVDRDIIKKIRRIQSGRIVPILETGIYMRRFYEVVPYYSKGDLSRMESLDEQTLRNDVIPFINEALNDVHTQGMAHMDLKPSNIFVDDQDQLFLGDFGICSILADESIKITRAKGTFGYRPPESYSEISIKSEQFDYYGFGMTLLHLLTGKSPYAGLSEMQIMAHTLDGKVLMPDDISDELTLLIKGLTAYDKKKRLGYEAVKRWCEGFDISDLVDASSRGSRGRKFAEGYQFKGQITLTIDDFAHVANQSMEHWDEAVQRFSKGLLDDFIHACGSDEAAALLDSKSIEDKEAGLSYFLYKVTDGHRLYWRTKCYKTLNAFGRHIQQHLPESPSDYVEMDRVGLIDLLINEVIAEGEEIERSSSIIKMYSFAFMASVNRQFNYRGRVATSFDELVIHMNEMTKSDVDLHLIDEMDRLMRSAYFKVWNNALENKTS